MSFDEFEFLFDHEIDLINKIEKKINFVVNKQYLIYSLQKKINDQRINYILN